MAQHAADPRRAARAPIAIIGIGCRFPGSANSPEAYWRLLTSGIDTVQEIPRDRFDVDAHFDPDPSAPGKMYTRWGAFVDSVDAFDAAFFGISPREAARMDPAQRLLLETAWEALEDAGQPPHLLAGSNTGVFVGISNNDYRDFASGPLNRHLTDAHAGSGAAVSIAANRISYCLGVRGPSCSVDTACSSALTAVHLACRSLEHSECDLALAGGVQVNLTPDVFIAYSKAGMLSPDGRCKAFNARANGFVRGEGCGVVLLKPLSKAIEHGDPIYAVIRGTAMNQDGRTPGLSVPSGEAQEALIWQALAEAGAAPSDIQYMEAHGTGTAVGDPIEAGAIGRVLSTGRRDEEPCLVGSVKTNLGHLEAAAGMAGLIKATLALKHRQIPGNLHFDQPNPSIPFGELRLRVPTTLEQWPATSGPAMAGVNSFGYGGANAHAVLEEPPRTEPVRSARGEDSANLLVISARDPRALRQLAEDYARALDDDGMAATQDVCYTSAVRRTHHEHRLAIVAHTRHDLVEHLDDYLAGEHRAAVVSGSCSRGTQRKLAFVYSGMGPLWWGMGRQLMRESPRFLQVLEECDRLFFPLSGWSLLDALSAGEMDSRVADADRAQVANFAIQTALTELWRSWGIVPDAVVGHSAGEIAASHAAGIFDLETALRIAFHRGRLQHRATDAGKMLAVGVSPDAVPDLLSGHDGRVSLAAVNSPTSITLSGEVDALERIAASLDEKGTFCRFLPVRVPYHGPQMDAIRDDLLASLAGLESRAATTQMVSSVTGDWVKGEDVDGRYWWRNVRQPVMFADAVRRLVRADYDLFVEVGPHPVLSAAVSECLAEAQREGVVVPTLRRTEDDRETMLRSLGALFTRGRAVDWAGVFEQAGSHVRLPTYRWQRERHWHAGASVSNSQAFADSAVEGRHPLLGRRLRSVHPSWEGSLAQPRLRYLADHAIQGTVLLPGAAYVEMALAASRELSPAGQIRPIERVTFHKPTFLGPQGASFVQFIYDEEAASFAIHSAVPGNETPWSLNASGKLGVPRSPSPLAPLDIDAVKARCGAEVSIDDWYRVANDRGYNFGPAFRCIERFWGGDREGIARISLPAAGLSADGYAVHPVLLDAAFQAIVLLVTRAANGEGLASGGLAIPVSVEGVTLHAAPTNELWVHVVASDAPSENPGGGATIFDDAGVVVMSVDGLRTKSLDASAESAATDVDDCLYEATWEPRALEASTVSEPKERIISADLGDRLRPVVTQLAEQWKWKDFRDTRCWQLDLLAAQLTRSALREMGCPEAASAPTDDLAQRLGIVSQHRRYFARLLENMSVAVIGRSDAELALSPRQLADLCVAERPECRSFVDSLLHVGERLSRVLRGELDPREVLFAPDALALLEAVYSQFSGIAFYQSMLAEAVGSVIQDFPASSTLRILEIGAGTGGATGFVLPKLRPERTTYTFTDLSTMFVSRAKKRFRDTPFMRFSVLDVERDPEGQDVAPHSFDLVLAVNVLHATQDLRGALRNAQRLLAPGGVLALIEGSPRGRCVDLLFGLTEGWWRFEDHDLRPSHPLLAPEEWRKVLAEVGFERSVAIHEVYEERDSLSAVVLAQATSSVGARLENGAARDGRSWLVLADRRGVGSRVAAELSKRGDKCAIVFPGALSRERDDQTIELTPDDHAGIARIMRELAGDRGAIHGVLHFWGIDAPPSDALTTTTLMDSQQLVCGSVLATIRAINVSGVNPSELWLVTAGSQAIDGANARINLAQAPLWGLGRSVAAERKKINCRLVDLGNECMLNEIESLVRELDADEPEEGIAYRGTQRFVSRMRRTSAAAQASPESPHPLPTATTPFRLDIGSLGVLESLQLRQIPDAKPAAGQISVRPLAAAINFKDVLNALGMLRAPGADNGEPPSLGFDGAGVVVECGDGVDDLRPGDEVVGVFPGGAFSSRSTTLASFVVRKPATMTFEQAATIPTVFLTAYYCLVKLAKLSAGERVLVHLGTGGVGLAAIQIARRIGAEIFTTAGSAEKRAHLQSLGVDHVMDSRSLDFADEIMRLTGGAGVDVVLNSLGGEAIAKGLSTLRLFGRFVEIGRRDIYQNTPIGMLALEKDLSVHVFDLLNLLRARPTEIQSLVREVMQLMTEGELQPLPHTAFDLSRAEDAFRFMAQSRHIGKVVLTGHAPAYDVYPMRRRQLFQSDATYLVVGGLGGFGAAVSNWMATHGARHLVVMTRSGVPLAANTPAVRALEQSGASVVVMKGDVSIEADVARVLGQIRREMPPLRGVLHSAMVVEDALLENLDDVRWRAATAPKVAGAWNLHAQTANESLDFFILFSSLSSLWGNLGQGNYAAANAFLDALAAHRRAHGRPSLAISWGSLSDVGYLADHPEMVDYIERQGIKPFTSKQAIEILARIMHARLPHLVAVKVDWETWWNLDPALAPLRTSSRRCEHLAVEATTTNDTAAGGAPILALLRQASPHKRLSVLEDYVAQNAAKVLGAAVDRLDRHLALTDMGFDSLMAVELANLLTRDLGVQVAVVKLLKGVTIHGLASISLDELALDRHPLGAPPAADEDAAPTPASVVAIHREERETRPTTPPPAIVIASDVVNAGNGHGNGRSLAAPAHWSPLLKVAQKTLAATFAMTAKLEVRGLEHIPPTGACVVATNHLSLLDAPLSFSVMPRKVVVFAARELSPLIRRTLDLTDAIYVRRGEADLEALERSLEVLRSGGMLGMAPEGTRSHSGGLGTGRTGIAYLAAKSGAPILPLVAYGQEQLGRNLRHLRRTPVVVRFGPLIHLPPGDESATTLRRNTEYVMSVLASMLPESYRGVYAGGDAAGSDDGS